MFKSCTTCKAEKPLIAFHNDKKAKDGLSYICKVCANQKTRLHSSQRDREERLKIKRIWQDKNRQHVNEYNNTWVKQNPEKHAARQAERKARKNQASPPWLTEEQRQASSDMYKLAKKFKDTFGLQYHVDHIIPLKGKTVCGLHVPWNLQILEASLNLKKSNNLKEDSF